MSNPTPAPRRNRRFLVAVVAVGIAATAVLGGSLSSATSGFSASISNNGNTVGTGTLVMSEVQGSSTCLSSPTGTVTQLNTGTCAINKYNGTTNAVPGTSYTSTVVIKNNGTMAANTFTLTPAGCSQAANGTTNGVASNFCSKVNITISDDTNGKCVFPASASACAAPSSANTLTSLGTSAISLAALAANTSRSFTFTVQVDSGVTNDYQGLLANETLNWAFSS